jgi:hypothetical protein
MKRVWLAAIAVCLPVSRAQTQDTTRVCVGDTVTVGGRVVATLDRVVPGIYSLPLIDPGTRGLPLRLAVLVVRDCGAVPSSQSPSGPQRDPGQPSLLPTDGEPSPLPTDSVIVRETFEDYADRSGMIRAGGGPWDVGGTRTSLTDIGGGRTGGRAMIMTKPAGLNGPVAERRIRGRPTRFFATFWFRLLTVGPNPQPEAKWVIVRHDAEGTAGCLGRPIARYQFALTTELAFGGNQARSRFGARGMQSSECNGPVVGDNQRGAFTWGRNPQDPAPVLANDPAIHTTPWGPINDGNWHRWTMELRTGDAAYLKLWLDGHLYWNSTGQRMRMPGRPTSFKLEMVSGTRSTEFTAYFDDLTLWTRP